MERLLEIDGVFQIAGRGLLVTPNIPWQATSEKFRPFRATVQVCTPDGTTRDLEAVFAWQHLSFVGGGGECNIAVVFVSATKADIPPGSVVFASKETIDAVHGGVP